MDQNQIAILVVVVVIAIIVVAAIGYVSSRKRRSRKLREHFGPEYERVLKQEGDPRKAEGVLEFREKRRDKFKIRALSAADRQSFSTRWREVQARFVDDPRGAVTVADSLVTDVMQARGYPIGEFDQRAADLSVDYPTDRRQLPRGARDCHATQRGPGQHGRFATGHDALPRLVRGIARRRQTVQ